MCARATFKYHSPSLVVMVINILVITVRQLHSSVARAFHGSLIECLSVRQVKYTRSVATRQSKRPAVYNGRCSGEGDGGRVDLGEGWKSEKLMEHIALCRCLVASIAAVWSSPPSICRRHLPRLSFRTSQWYRGTEICSERDRLV